MKINYLFIKSLFVAILICSSVQAQNVVITSNQTPQQLVNNLVGAGINPTNITGQLTPLSNGTFINNGANGFSLTAGIILSNGLVDMIGDTNATYHNSTDLGMAGDSDLDAIVFPRVTEDASILEFDFSAANDSVEFYFIFASEEYNDYANTNFNDVFAFIINGPGYNPNTNVALIPGTTVPISINTVNNGNSGGTATGPCMNCAYYIDNVGTNAVAMSLDGYTVVIQIKFPVWPCAQYHFKIGVADAGDGVFDSAVMLEENSFVACPLMQGFRNDVAINDTVYVCAGGTVTITAPEGLAYSWSSGDTTRSITVNQPGIYNFVIYDPQGICFAYSDNIIVVQSGAIQSPVIIQNGNLLSAPNINPAPGITYQWYIDGDEIPNANQSTFQITGNGCYMLTIFEGTCESSSNTICVTNTSIFEIPENKLLVFPHPLTDISTIETPFEENSLSTIQLFDVTGRAVISPVQQRGKLLTIEKNNLPSGVYFLEISNSNYQGSIKRKVVIR